MDDGQVGPWEAEDSPRASFVSGKETGTEKSTKPRHNFGMKGAEEERDGSRLGHGISPRVLQATSWGFSGGN